TNEPRADFYQRSDLAIDGDMAFRGHRYTRQDFEQRAFARAVTADDSQYLPFLHIEMDVIESLEFPPLRQRTPVRASREALQAEFQTLQLTELELFRDVIYFDDGHGR